MATNGKINFEVGFITNSKGLKELKSELAEIRSMANNADFTAAMDPSKIQSMVKSANDLEYAMNAAFDVDLNTVNIQKFNQILKQSGTDLSTIQQNLAAAGTIGQSAFLKATAGLMQFNTAAKQTNHFLDSIATSFANTIKWSAMSSIINTISGTIQKSYYYVKDLDTALNDIRIVTGKSADEMDKFAESANNAAKALAVTTEDYTQGSLIYYQQGLDDETVKTLTDITAKTSNVTGQSMSAVSEQLTAVWNGYQVANEAAQEGMQVYEEYVDKMAAVGASTASDLQELSTAMSKVASAASAMGVSFDDLNAQIATIVSVTRQAPESVGTALKTIYARLGDLKIEGADEFGVSLGEVSGQLDAIGIHILDTSGQMRNMSDVMADVAVKWDTWTEAQRQAAAVAMAGKRQYNNLIALFDNWDMYGEALETSMSAAGTLEEQQAIALDSLSNKMDTLKATAEDLYDSLYDESDIKSLVEGLTDIVQVLADFSDSIGGLINLIPMLGSTAARVFSNQIANGLSTIIINAQNARKETQMMAENANQLKMMFSDSSLFSNTGEEDISPAMQQGVEQLKRYYGEMQQYQSIMSQEQKETYNNILNNIAKVGEYNIEIEKINNKLADEKNSWKLIGSEILENNEDVSKIYKEVGKINTVVEKLENQLNDIGTENLSLDEFKDLLKGLDTNQVDILVNKFKELSQNGSITEENFQKIIDKLKEVGGNTEEIAKLTQQMRNLRDGTKEAGESLRDNLSLQQHISNITNTVGALGQLATSIHTLKNIGSIWSSNDIDAGEKLLQIIMNLSFSLPALFSSIQKINSILGINASIIQTLNARDTARQAIQNAGLVLDKKITKEKIEQQLINKILARGTSDLTVKEEEEILARGASINAISAETKAKIINTGATEAEKAALEEATIAQNTFNASVLANPYVLVAGAIIAAIGGLIFAYDSYHKKLKEDAELQLERLSSVQKELDANEELYQSYHKLKKDFDDGVDNKDQLKEATLNLCEAYGLEADRLDLLNGKYEKINAQIEEYRKGQLEQQKRTLTSELANTATKAIETSRDTKQDEWNGIDARNIDFGQDDKLDKILSEKVDFYNNGTMLIEANNIKELAQAYNQIKDAQVAYTKSTSEEEQQRSKAFRSMNNWLAEVGPVIESYEALQEQIKNTDAEIVLAEHNFNNVDSLQEYQNEIQAVANELVELGYSEEEAKDMAETHAAAVTNATETFSQQVDIIKVLAKEVHLSEEEVEKFINNLSDEEKEILFSGQIDIDNLKTLENVEKAIEIVQDQVNAEDVGIIVSLRDKVTSSKKLSKKEIEEQMGEESKLGQDYQLAMADFDMESKLDQVDILNGMLKDRMELDKEYINNVGEVAAREKALYEERRKNADLELESLKRRKAQILDQQRWRELTEEEEEALKECNQEIAATEAALDSYTKAIEHYQDVIDNGLLPEEAETKIFDNMIAGIDGVISKADVLKDLVSVVGENWTFAAEKIEEFAQNFPEVLRYQENYNVLQDGSIQLTEQGQQALQKEIELKKQELIAENQAYQEELQHDADLLYAEAEYYEEQAQYLTDYLEGKRTGADVEAKLEKSKHDYFNRLTEITGQNQQDLMDSIVKNYGVVNNQASKDTKDIFNYWCSIGQAAAAASLAYQNKSFTPPTFNQGAHASVGSTYAYKPKDYDEGEFINQANLAEIEEMRNTAIEKAESAKNKADIKMSKKAASASATQAAINAMDNAASGVGNGKSSKSGSNKEKKITPKEEEEYKPDLYYEIEKAIKAVDRAIQQLSEDEKNLYGKAKIKALKEENKLLDKQLANLKEKQKIQQQEASELRGRLSAGGVSFGANGEVQNYNQALQNATEQYNSVIRQYNAGLVDDEQVKAAKKILDDFKSDIDRYSKLFYDEIPELIKEMRAKIREQLSNNLEAFEIKYQLKLDKKQAKREWNSYWREMKKDFRKVYESLDKDMKVLSKNAKTYTSKNGTINTDIKEIKEVQKEINKLNKGKKSTMFENISQAQEKLKELNEQLQQHGQELHDLYKEAWENYLAQIDQAKEKFEQLNGVIDRAQSNMEHLLQIQEKLYRGTKTYADNDDAYRRQYDLAQTKISVARQEYELNKKMFEDSGASMNNMSKWTEDQLKYYENMVSAEERMWEGIEEGAEAAEKRMVNSINKIHDELEKAFTNGFGFEELDKQWEDIDWEAEAYYDTIEQGYEVQKLNNKVTQDMLGKSVKAQEKLKKFQTEELKKLREKDKLSKYELKRAQLMYDITLKEIALEEAQNNKSSMKLTRNSEGNWSYQYVADEDETSKAQQDLLDAQMAFREASKEEYQALLKEQLNLQKNFNSEASELFSKYQEMYGADKEIWTPEQKEAYKNAQDQLAERYEGKLRDVDQRISTAKRDLAAGDYTVQQTLWSQLGEEYTKLTDSEIENFKRFSGATLTEFTTLYNAIVGEEGGESGLEGIKTAAENISSKVDVALNTMYGNQKTNVETLDGAVRTAWANEENAAKAYQNAIIDLGITAGKNLGKEGIKGELDAIKASTDAAATAAEKLKKKYEEVLPEALKQVNAIKDAWDKVAKKIKKAHEWLEKYSKIKNKSNPAFDDASVNTSTGASTGGATVDAGGGDTGDTGAGAGGSVDNSGLAEGVAAAIWLQGATTSGWGNNPIRAQRFAEKGVSAAQGIINSQGPSGDLYKNWNSRRGELSSYYYGAFDTGGYTGDWEGNEGQLAVLHKKEIVLNKDDTKNFLDATNTLRDLVSLDDSITNSIASAISRMLLAMGQPNIGDTNSNQNNVDNTNKVFNITAEFPNANDVSTIREAILSLPNLANQYINQQRI